MLTEPAQPLSLKFILAIVATHHYDVSKSADDLTLSVTNPYPLLYQWFHRILYSKNMCERYEYMCMCTTKTFTAQLHNNISHRLIHVLGPDLPGVWYRGRGHVWEECGRSMFMYGSSYARSSLCSLGVFLVTVCIEMNWLQSHCFLTESISSHVWFVCVCHDSHCSIVTL